MPPPPIGLPAMPCRAYAAGGALLVESAPGQGSVLRLRLRLPLPAGAAAAS